MAITQEQLAADIQVASVLISLGMVSVARIKTFFQDQGHDAETLDDIMKEVDIRIARRS